MFETELCFVLRAQCWHNLSKEIQKLILLFGEFHWSSQRNSFYKPDRDVTNFDISACLSPRCSDAFSSYEHLVGVQLSQVVLSDSPTSIRPRMVCPKLCSQADEYVTLVSKFPIAHQLQKAGAILPGQLDSTSCIHGEGLPFPRFGWSLRRSA